MNILFNLNPKEDKFYKLFSLSAKNVCEAAATLRETMDNLQDKQMKVKNVEELEHRGDQIVHDTIEELNTAFITPIDREDIYDIIKMMDDIVDHIEAAMHRFVMFDINEVTKEAKRLCDMIVEATEENLYMINDLKNMGKSKIILEKVIKINKIENDGDTYFRQTITDLFKSDNDVLTIIKWREIYQFLENTIDSCEGVANIIEGVVMKHV